MLVGSPGALDIHVGVPACTCVALHLRYENCNMSDGRIGPVAFNKALRKHFVETQK